jgi:cytochrome c553
MVIIEDMNTALRSLVRRGMAAVALAVAVVSWCILACPGLTRAEAPKPAWQAPPPPAGLKIAERSTWRADLQAFLVERTLTNPGREAVRAASVPLAEWPAAFGDEDLARYRELTHRDDLWYGTTYWTGPDWTRVGKTWQHPGENTPSIRRFLAPQDGRIAVSGRVYKLHAQKGTDGVRLTIRHNRRDVWTAEIDGDDAKGGEPKLVLDVRKGDSIRFVVHKRGQIVCDTTFWDPAIAYAGGASYQASQAFATSKQPGNPWSYEMEADGSQAGLPRAYTFLRDGWLLDEPLRFDVPPTAASQPGDALPLLVLADGRGQGGAAMAVLGPAQWRLAAGFEPVDARADAPRILRLRLVAREGREIVVGPGEELRLPPVAIASYSGPWFTGATALARIVESPQTPDAASVRAEVVAAWRDLKPFPTKSPSDEPLELDYWAMIQAEWRREDKLADSPEACLAAARLHLAKARALAAELRGDASELDPLAKRTEVATASLADARALYLRVRCLKRRIALASPLLDFGPMFFCKRVPTSYSHLVMQYYGWRARPGGGLFVLPRPGRSLACRDILDGRLAAGSVLEPRLSWDARRVVFSFVESAGRDRDPNQLNNSSDDAFFHLYEVGIDGSGLRQLTAGPYDDLMPTYLPDGGIVFTSTRRRGYARCFGGQFSPRWHVYTLHRVDADGGNLRCLSVHDTNEWFPAVAHDGSILYSRWDYIDRDAVTHQNLWSTRPDGTNPLAVWGNATPSPHCTFQIQPIPGSQKVVFTASAHHSVTAGSIVVCDPAVGRDGQRALTRITPEVPFPEAETMNIPEYYEAPWPLDERHFLAGYSSTPLVWEPGANPPGAVGIYLIDASGNRELIYRDPSLNSTTPCPLVPRAMPPLVATSPASGGGEGEMVLADVYRGLGDVARGSVKQLRIVQIFPKTTNVGGQPPIGLAGEENGRAILGTVPVESDGSARFRVPSGKPVLFQALDADGQALQTMRTITYVQPGERIACTGCHEDRMTAPPSGPMPTALRRAPSSIDPGRLGGRPFGFVEVVQPILDRHCVRCHGGEKTEGKVDLARTPRDGFTQSYVALCGDRNFWAEGTNPKNAAEALVPRFGGRNQLQRTPPGGMYGARGSRLVRLLRQGHHDVRLTDEDFRSIAAWIDLNAIFYGINDPQPQAKQLRGEPVAMPEIQ